MRRTPGWWVRAARWTVRPGLFTATDLRRVSLALNCLLIALLIVARPSTEDLCGMIVSAWALQLIAVWHPLAFFARGVRPWRVFTGLTLLTSCCAGTALLVDPVPLVPSDPGYVPPGHIYPGPSTDDEYLLTAPIRRLLRLGPLNEHGSSGYGTASAALAIVVTLLAVISFAFVMAFARVSRRSGINPINPLTQSWTWEIPGLRPMRGFEEVVSPVQRPEPIELIVTAQPDGLTTSHGRPALMLHGSPTRHPADTPPEPGSGRGPERR